VAKRTVEILESLGMRVERPDLDGVVVNSYEFVWLLVEKGNIVALLVKLVA
jgi:hypothetical protein